MLGASLYWPINNMLYVEGYALDEFASGNLGLRPKSSQTIGLLLDRGIEKDLQLRHLQVASAARATLGINVAQCVVTSSPVEVHVDSSSLSGSSWGGLKNVDTLLEAAQWLYDKGCTAIAVVVRFPEDEEGDETTVQQQVLNFQQYRLGNGVDHIAGAEAIISHVITKHFMLPCAHAPAFLPSEVCEDVSPKSCAEELGYTYLPCVLAYLHRAPDLIPNKEIVGSESTILTCHDVDAVVVPADALGGSAVLSFIALGKLIVAVEDNKTCMKASLTELKISSKNIVVARSYAEAAGILAAHKAGILLESITNNVESVPITFL